MKVYTMSPLPNKLSRALDLTIHKAHTGIQARVYFKGAKDWLAP